MTEGDLQPSFKGGNVLTHRIRQLVRKLPRNNQKGFTLIEMLVVISILGILAAVVTMSMIGVTNLAQSRADSTELKTVQVALDTMANEQGVPASSVCPNAALQTQSMDQFPVAPTASPAANSPVPLYPRYLRNQTTHKQYSCDATGVVTQH